jgi:hypothetical protein
MGTSPLQPEELIQLQLQLAQVQDDPAAQQQLLGSYAVFVPPMLPIDVSAGMRGAGGAMGLQGVDSHSHRCDVPEQDGWFDEDGMASESLLKQLTNPSNALYGVADADDQYYSGYLHPSAAAGPDQAAPLVHLAGAAVHAQVQQSMQQTVDQYRQHLQNLQQRAQRQLQQQQ